MHAARVFIIILFCFSEQPDAGAYWRSWYEVDNLQEVAHKLYNELKPFYQQLHAYVRRKLYDIYGSDYINLEGPIPAHLLGLLIWLYNTGVSRGCEGSVRTVPHGPEAKTVKLACLWLICI